MSIYKYNLEVNIHDVDFNGIARTSSVMRYIQSAAQSQLNENGMTYEALYGRHKAFFLSRIRIEIDEPIRAYRRLTASSFPCESRGYSFLRCYGLESDGMQIARAVSLWALVDTETRSLIKVNDFDLGLTLHKPNELMLKHFKIPSNLEEVGEFRVNYSNADQNRHMNNTAYPDMYSSFLPLDGKRIRSITINYSNEAPIGEKLRVFQAEENGIFYFRTVREDGKINSESEIVLCDIEY